VELIDCAACRQLVLDGQDDRPSLNTKSSGCVASSFGLRKTAVSSAAAARNARIVWRAAAGSKVTTRGVEPRWPTGSGGTASFRK
jgi:hypothetical protein